MERKFRLKSSRAFSAVYKRGESVSDKFIVLMWLKGKDDNLRLGFTVSKKIGKSVVRNKIRRRMKEAARTCIPRMTNGYICVCLARSPIIDAQYEDILKSIESLLLRAKLIVKAENL